MQLPISQYLKIPSLFEYTYEVHSDISKFDASLNHQYRVLLKVNGMYWCNLPQTDPSFVEEAIILCIFFHIHPLGGNLLLCIPQNLPMWASYQEIV